METLGDVDRALWKQLRDECARQERGQGPALIERETSVSADPSIAARSLPGAHGDVRKPLLRFVVSPNRPASDVCDDYLRLARRFADEFVRDYSRFLP